MSSTKKISILAVLALILSFANAAWAQVKVTKLAHGLKYNFEIEDVAFNKVKYEGLSFVKANLVGVGEYSAILYKVGFPEIPVIRFYTEGSVEIKAGGRHEKMLVDEPSARLKPNQPSLPKIRGAKVAFMLNRMEYDNNSFYPEKDYEVQNVGSIRGKHRRLVTLYPLHYNAKTGQYQVISSFTVKTRDRSVKEETSGREAFVFVAAEKFHNSIALQKYAKFKESLGYKIDYIWVKPKTDTPADKPEDIRAKLKKLYSTPGYNLRYALIIGDAEDVPAIKAPNLQSGITDHYYRAIDTDDYTKDINGPDIGVGRISVGEEAQLSVVVDKYIRYQTGVFANEDWLNKISYLATDDKWEIAEATHNYAIQTYTAPAGYTGIFPTMGIQGGDQLYEITHKVPDETVNQAMQEGRTIINYSGHGATTNWDAPNVTQEEVRRIAHPDALPFVISNACITGDFRVSESFAETWQRHPAGAVMFWGSMDSSLWDEDDILERRMYDEIFANKKLKFEDITDYALSEVWRHYGGSGKSAYYWETYTTFGDPSIRLRTKRPVEAVINGPSVVPFGMKQIKYVISDMNGNPSANARISLNLSDGTSVAAADTDSLGEAVLNLGEYANTPSEFTVIVYGDNLKITRSELKTYPSETPFVGVTGYQVNGRTDPVVSVSETVNMGLTLQNFGLTATSGGTIEILGVDGPASVLSAKTAFSVIPAGGKTEIPEIPGNPLTIKINPDANNGDTVKVRYSWQTQEGQIGAGVKNLRVIRGTLAIGGVDFGTPGNPDVGGIKPGETGPVYLTVTNNGSEPILDAQLVPEAGSCVSSVSGTIRVDSLNPGVTARIETPVNVTIDPACTFGRTVSLRLSGTYSSYSERVALSADTGFLAGVLTMEDHELANIGLSIPDNGPAVLQSLPIETSGIIKDISVHIRITHSYLSDLVVKLIHPNGTEVFLHNKTGLGADNLDKVYGFGGEPVPGLQGLNGLSTKGEWKLSVQDTASSDVGTLDYIKLTLKGYLE